ncbi:efflux RND transporter periplasmic adaptor subunit [Rhodopirellula bahusiensis]|uniref:efflux RND transporter periplasmic adaptor subunit n=1 Tax=Rhodopirellula bahusiensis TaxID=2014065 RepID=UPI001E5D123D|nr:efflux RND transporter periplasmic adaptor subunit [Rhodopirellula bahusiensis]
MSALVALLVVVAAAWNLKNRELGTNQVDASASDEADREASPTIDFDDAQRICLSDRKINVAGIRWVEVQRGTLVVTRTLPARFAYDDTRHVSLRTPTDGVLESILVKPGDSVDRGQPVAVLRSPSIGTARNQILSEKAKLDLAQETYRWEADSHAGVSDLAKRIRAGEAIDAIKQSLKDKTIGEFGGQLLTMYSKSNLANQLSRSVGDLGDSGAISGRVIQERQSDRQQSEAALEAAIEQSLFQTRQSMIQAEAKRNDAERRLRIAKQTLGTLLGTLADSMGGLDVSPNELDVSRLTIQSPLTGTIESKTFSASERVAAQDELFVIADTSSLWVEADIRGRDWQSIHVSEGDVVRVSTPAMNMPPQPATVYTIGRQVDPASGAIPLVAKIDNSKWHFRPGLFARMAVPTETLHDVILVAGSAVVDLDGQTSVFVVSGDGFESVSVEVGSQSGGMVEIREGLTEGQLVVVSGAFALKSELLLEGEE